MTDSALVVKKKYFNLSGWLSKVLRTNDNQVSLMGRTFEFGDIIKISNGYIVVGKRPHILSGHVLEIPLFVAEEFEDVMELVSPLLKEYVDFKIDCSTTNKSAMSLINQNTNCYWNNISMIFNFGRLYSHEIFYFRSNPLFYFRDTESDSPEEVFEEHCGEWTSILVVLTSESGWKTKGVGVHHGYSLLETENYSKRLRKRSEVVEIHYGLKRQIENLVTYIDENLRCTQMTFAEKGMRFAASHKDTDILCITTYKQDREEVFKQKYFHAIILDVCIALAPCNIANYEMREIINLLPGMRHQKDYRMMRTIFSVKQSIKKILENKIQ